jgi:hypothetical protein
MKCASHITELSGLVYTGSLSCGTLQLAHYSRQNENQGEPLRERSKGLYRPVNALQTGCNYRNLARYYNQHFVLPKSELFNQN